MLWVRIKGALRLLAPEKQLRNLSTIWSSLTNSEGILFPRGASVKMPLRRQRHSGRTESSRRFCRFRENRSPCLCQYLKRSRSERLCSTYTALFELHKRPNNMDLSIAGHVLFTYYQPVQVSTYYHSRTKRALYFNVWAKRTVRILSFDTCDYYFDRTVCSSRACRGCGSVTFLIIHDL